MVVNSKFKIPTVQELFKSFRNPRRDWNIKNPMQKWCYLYSFGRVSFDIIRFPLFRENINDIHWFGYFVFVYYITGILLMLYTLCFYMFHGEVQNSLKPTSLTICGCGLFPVLIELFSKTRFKIQKLMDFGGQYVYRDNRESDEYNRICSDHMDVTMRSFIVKTGMLFLSLSVCLIGPLHAYFVYGIKTTTTEYRMPFCELKSNAEFQANLIIQSIIAMHAAMFIFGLEVLHTIFEDVVTIAPKLVRSELSNTIQLYEDKAISELQLIRSIERIVKLCQDTDNYVSSLSDILFWRNLSIPVAFTYSIGMSIYCQYALDFAAGYGLAGMLNVQLFFVCEFGQNIQDNGFPEMLYESQWEILPPKVQRVIMLLIDRKQNERGLKLGPFGVGINRESFKLSTNKIYTFVMFLVNFFN